jgi:hypothetical protein
VLLRKELSTSTGEKVTAWPVTGSQEKLLPDLPWKNSTSLTKWTVMMEEESWSTGERKDTGKATNAPSLLDLSHCALTGEAKITTLSGVVLNACKKEIFKTVVI